jgi:peptidoglycan/LPS O-acetylase OafA/YrhL
VAADVFTPLRMDGLVLGAWLALAARGAEGLGMLKRWAQPTLLFAGIAALTVDLLGRRLFGLPNALWAAACGALLILVVAAPKQTWLGRWGHSHILRFFGKYSYAMYVVQLPLVYWLAPYFTAGGIGGVCGSAVAGQAVYCAVMFGVTTGLAVMSWYAFEKHFMELKRRFEQH